MHSIQEVAVIYSLLKKIKHNSTIHNQELEQDLNKFISHYAEFLSKHGAFPIIDDVNGELIKEVEEEEKDV